MHRKVHEVGAGGLFALFFILVFTAAAPRAHALDDPGLDYHTITTKHFHVHYFTGLEDLAKKVAVTCEEAHQLLSPLFDWVPASRTHVFVTDKLDSANGSAQVYGRNFITIFGMPPESDSVLGYYDDWIRILVYHEYVHILHLDTVTGPLSWVNALIGKQLNPNQLLPRWLIEGLAVYHESARTGTGRVNSSLYQMWLRAEALSSDPLDLGQVSNSPTRWPFGSTPYLMGGFFMHWVHEQVGEACFTQFNKIYGGKVIPYAINQSFKKACGSTYDELWRDFSTYIIAKSHAERVAVRAAGETRLEFVTEGGGDSKWPALRPGGKEVSYLRADLFDHPIYETYDEGSGKRRELLELNAGAGPSAWAPDAERLVFTRATIEENVYTFQDLFVHDATRGTTTQLTTSERAREPMPSPDGTQLAYVRNRAGTMELVVREFTDRGVSRAERVLVSGLDHPWDDDRHWQQIATPVWSPDGKHIVFSWWRLDLRQRDLWRIEVETGELEPLMRDEAMDLDPYFGPDGLLYFSSDRTGIYNIHAMDLETRKVWRLTNVVMGVFTPRPSADGSTIYVTTYGKRGYDIAKFERPSLEGMPLATASTQHVAWRGYPEIDEELEVEPYRPARWLAPLVVFPSLSAATSGAALSANVQGYDPLRRHTYSASAGILVGTQGIDINPSVGFNYATDVLPVDFVLSAAYNQFPRNNSLFVNSQFVPYLEQQAFGRATVRYPFRDVDDGVTLSGSYALDWRAFVERPQPQLDPGSVEPEDPPLGFFNEATLSLSYADIERFPYSISIERGVNASIALSVQHPALGSSFESVTIQGGGAAYLPNPWLERHVLSVSGFGGFIDTTFNERAAFAVGGLGPQNLFSALIFQTPTGGRRVRGYDPFALSGNKFFVANTEYRFPIWDVDQGFSTAPVYFRRIKGRVFFDAGSAFDGVVADATLLTGAGAEIQVDAIFGYYLSGDIRVGYAYGFEGELGKQDVYILFGGGF